MRNNRRPLATCGFLLLSCLVTIICLRLLFTVPIPRTEQVNLYNLTLSLAAFPFATEIWEGPMRMPRDPSIDLNSEDNLSVFFKLAGSNRLSSHFLYKFPNAFRSWWEFGTAHRVWFYDPNRYNWETPPGWSYQSPIADAFTFKCAEIESYSQDIETLTITRCTAVARYGEFISKFSTPLVPGVMELDDVERILREIDNRMVAHLK